MEPYNSIDKVSTDYPVVSTRVISSPCYELQENSLRPHYNPGKEDPIDSEIFKNQRQTKKRLAEGLRVMKAESKNGFIELPKKKKQEVLETRIKMLRKVVTQGNFIGEDYDNLMVRVHRRASKIYKIN